MNTKEIESKIRELRQLQALIAEAEEEAEAIKDAIKAVMGDSEALRAGEYSITWKPVTTARIDTNALKKAMPDVAAAFTREVTTRRFFLLDIKGAGTICPGSGAIARLFRFP